jgi:hypothetical protein
MAKPPDWSRPLPAALQILDESDKPILTLATVGDVRDLIVKRLPEESRQKSTWQYVAGVALHAANGGDGADLSVALRMVLTMEGIACRSERMTAYRRRGKPNMRHPDGTGGRGRT